MKKLLSISFALTLMLGFSACKKNNSNTNGTNPVWTAPIVVTPPVDENPIGDMPPDFTKKTVIEERTGVWCGWCPLGAWYMAKSVEANPDRVYGIAYHVTDVFSGLYDANTLAAETALSSDFAMSGVPSGVVGRDGSTDNYNVWVSASASQLSQTPKAGLAIVTKEIVEGQYEVEVHAGFNANLSGDYRVVVYLTEDEIHKGAGYNQSNYTYQDANYTTIPYYNYPSPMTASQFTHEHVLRQIISKSIWGDAIDATQMKAGGEFISKYVVDLTSEMDPKNCHIVAMIVKKGSSASQHSLENAQACKIGEVKKWD